MLSVHNQANAQLIRQLQIEKDKSVSDFVSEMTFVINALYSKNRRDDDIVDIHDKYLTVRTENSEVIILNVGPYIWKYRQPIESGKMQPLLDNEFNTEIEEAKGDLPDEKKLSYISTIIGKIKRCWHLLTPQEQEVMKKKFRAMISFYAIYVSVCKKLRDQGAL